MSAGARCALLVDLGGVLFDFDHEHRLGQLGRLFGESPSQVESALWDSGFSADADAGKYPTAADVRAEVRRITGYAGSDDDLDQAWCSAFRPATEVAELVARTPAVRAVFTNNGPLEEQVLTRLYPDVFAPFDRLLFCHRLVANKPDLRVYQQVTALLGVEPVRILFIDDGEDNVDAARTARWTASQYRGIDDLRALIE